MYRYLTFDLRPILECNDSIYDLSFFISSHERKKKYWEQLELRCRHLYRRPPPFGGHHHPHMTSTAATSIMLTPGNLTRLSTINI